MPHKSHLHPIVTFSYNNLDNSDSIDIYLIAESKNWPIDEMNYGKDKYKLERGKDKYEVSIRLWPGKYYYRILVDTLLITNPNSKEEPVFVNGDSLSVKTVGQTILPLVILEAGSAHSDSQSYNYFQTIPGLMIQYPINPYNIIRLRYYSIESYLPLPPTKYAYAGGMGSLRGYDSKEFKGSFLYIYNLEYERTFYINKFN